MKVLQPAGSKYIPLTSFVTPCYYEQVVDAAQELATKSPQLGLAIGHYVKQICLQKIATAIKDRSDSDLKDAEDFMKLYSASWSSHVAAPTGRRQRLKQLNKAVELPLTSDIRKITDYLQKSIDAKLRSVSPDVDKLVKLTLTSLIFFNKRRPAEVAELRFSDVQQAASNTEEDNMEIMQSLSEAEKTVAKR